MPRKTKKFYEVTPKLLRKIERLAKRLNLTQIAVSIGWSRETLYKKMEENSDIADAIERGQTSGINEISGSL
jgi:predicted sugar kinase